MNAINKCNTGTTGQPKRFKQWYAGKQKTSGQTEMNAQLLLKCAY